MSFYQTPLTAGDFAPFDCDRGKINFISWPCLVDIRIITARDIFTCTENVDCCLFCCLFGLSWQATDVPQSSWLTAPVSGNSKQFL